MRVVKSSKLTELNKLEFEKLKAGFAQVVIDLGTGDGRFVYENAKAHAGNLYVGVDPAYKQMETYSKQSARKKLTNTLLVVGSLELLPTELIGCAQKLYIHLPWGSLLEAVVRPTSENVKKLTDMLETGGELELVFGYTSETEPSETERLNLPELTDTYVKDVIVAGFVKTELFKFVSMQKIEKQNLTDKDTSWGKKLGFGRKRPVYELKFKKL
jgi:16S rRNA (adenine(1408)-N(1))-methyltransferase